ncbi:MAG: UDP-N-acetylglucosamine 1-carboxyvinyltransferase, partial [Planctomycetes bacterium]|nr:UDP-N-acetylglucosamine 1-carboxyvinyltransferase [Planctomycetota bacterium]
MSNFIINGGRHLSGQIETNAAKNSAVAILCATAMIKGTTTLSQVPVIEEVKRIIEVLTSIGLKIKWTGEHSLSIQNDGKLNPAAINQESFLKTRSGLLLMGALAYSLNDFSLPNPSGCRLGVRTVNPHAIALSHLGITVKCSNRAYLISKKETKAAEFTMYESGDTATENAVMAALFTPGRTTIHFASANYMVQDLCCFLRTAGARIEGIGASTLRINGVKELKPVKEYLIMPDPIESMAFISIAITTRSKLLITRCPIDFLRLEMEKLRLMGQKFKISRPYKSANGQFDL